MGRRSRERMAGPEGERVARGVERRAQEQRPPPSRVAFPLLLLGAAAKRRHAMRRMAWAQRVQAGRAKALRDRGEVSPAPAEAPPAPAPGGVEPPKDPRLTPSGMVADVQ